MRSRLQRCARHPSVMAEAIAALTLLRDRYKAAGKLIAARTVERCIAVVRRIG